DACPSRTGVNSRSARVAVSYRWSVTAPESTGDAAAGRVSSSAGSGAVDQRGGDGGDPFAATGEAEPAGGGRRHRDRGADEPRERRLRREPSRPHLGAVAHHLHGAVADRPTVPGQLRHGLAQQAFAGDVVVLTAAGTDQRAEVAEP